MIDLYYWTTPNGHKLTMFLEETGVAYTLKPVNISRGEQFTPEFLAIAPNNRIPAIVDHAPAMEGGPLAMFESGSILLYLADKTGRLIPADARERWQCIQWLFWQMAGLGPMAGQNHHFGSYAIDPSPYAIVGMSTRPRACTRCSIASCEDGNSSSMAIRSRTSRAIRGFSRSGSGRTSTTSRTSSAGKRGSPNARQRSVRMKSQRQ